MIKSTLITLTSSLVLVSPTLAEGLLTVQYPNGDSENYPDIAISSNDKVLSIQDGEKGKNIKILKKDCVKEGEVTVCSKGTVILDTYGVKETLLVKEMVVFTNTTNKTQPIQNSQVTLSPKSLMAEILTQKGTYINVSGKIDSEPRP